VRGGSVAAGGARRIARPRLQSGAGGRALSFTVMRLSGALALLLAGCVVQPAPDTATRVNVLTKDFRISKTLTPDEVTTFNKLWAERTEVALPLEQAGGHVLNRRYLASVQWCPMALQILGLRTKTIHKADAGVQGAGRRRLQHVDWGSAVIATITTHVWSRTNRGRVR
jgi:hypothetical protein